MPKPNSKCPCGSGTKYKKCCRSKGTYANLKRDEQIERQIKAFPNFGQKHPTYRFSIGHRVRVRTDPTHPKGSIGTVKSFDYDGDAATSKEKHGVLRSYAKESAAYTVLLDTGSVVLAYEDVDSYIWDLDETVVQAFDPATLKNFGQTDPKLRFSIGQCIEYRDDQATMLSKTPYIYLWRKGWIRKFGGEGIGQDGNHMTGDYQITTQDSLDTKTSFKTMLVDDADDRIRPFGFNKTPQNEMCAMCGKDKTTAGIQLANCGGCRRVKYCST